MKYICDTCGSKHEIYCGYVTWYDGKKLKTKDGDTVTLYTNKKNTCSNCEEKNET